MSSLKYILDNNEDEYHPASYNSHEAEGSSSHGTTSTLVYRGSSSKSSKPSKPSKSSKSPGGGSSSSSKPSGSSSKSSHHHASKGKSNSKGKHKSTEEDDLDEADDYDYDYDQSSTQYTMDSGTEYGASSDGQYYQQPHHGHAHHESSRGGRGVYYMDPNAGANFNHIQNPPIMHNPGVTMGGSYDTAAMHNYGSMHGMDSSAMAQGDMTGFGGMAGYGSQQEGPSFTPVTHRPSRAKKGKPVHFCDMCEPRRTFTRAEHLRQVQNYTSSRHQLIHKEPRHVCTFPGCTRIFFRADLLQRHQLKQHTGRTVSNGSGSNDSTDWRSSSGEEMPQDADDGDGEPSNRRGSTQSSDSPGGGWATTGAVRSTTYFSMSDGNPGSKSNNNHDSSINPDTGDTPPIRQRRRRQSNVARSGPKGHCGSGGKHTTRSERKTKPEDEDESEILDDGQPLGGQSASLHNVGLDELVSAGGRRKGRSGRESGRGRRTRAPEKRRTHTRHATEETTAQLGPGAHGFLVSGIASSGTHQHAFHNTTESETYPTSNIAPQPFDGHLRPRDEAHDTHYTQSEHSEHCDPFMQAQPLQAHVGSYSRHTRSNTVPDANYAVQQQPPRLQHHYHNSDPPPAIGWSISANNMGHGSADHGFTSDAMTFDQSGSSEAGAVPNGGAGHMGYTLHTASYHMTPERYVGTTSNSSLGPIPRSSHDIGSARLNFVYEQPVSPSAGQAVAYSPGAVPPLPPLAVSNLPHDYMSASNGFSVRHMDGDSSSGSWAATSSLLSSISSSTRHTCATIDDMDEGSR